eukprot:6574906-Ditylum_brightwellii.AAC.1
MEEFPQFFAKPALSVLHKLMSGDALASTLHWATYMQWPSYQSHLSDIISILHSMATWCFLTQGLRCPANIIKHFLPYFHLERYRSAESRVQYVSVVLTTFLICCQQLICGEQPDNDLRPLPLSFLTPFISEVQNHYYNLNLRPSG